MYRIIFFLATIIIPIIFSWWLFIPLALLSIYLIKLPYEIILVGLLLDSFYYFGDSFLAKHLLAIFSVILLLLAWFLSSRIHWRKII